MNHLTPEQMTGHLDGALDPRADAVVERHLAACVRCRVELASLASQDDRLRASLTHDPGEAYFETFADRVLERARTAAPEPDVATFEPVARVREITRAAHRGFLDWLSPRGIAWAGSVAAVIAAAGLVFVTARERNVDHLRSPELIRRSEQAAPPVEATPASPAPDAASIEGALNDRDEALKKLQAPAGQDAPAAGSRVGAATGAKESERRDAASGTLDRPAFGVDGKSQSAPSRMVEVQRAPNGEEVPVRKNVAPGFAASPPAAQAPSAAPTGAVTVTKPKPQPMSESANEKNKQETGASLLDKAVRESSTDARQRKSANAAAPPSPTATAERGQLSYRSGAPAPKAALSQDALAPSAKDEVRRCGVVRDARGKGLAGAQVAIADLGRVAMTDSAGRFCITAPAGLHTVSAYGLRFAPLRQDATFGSGEDELVLVVEPVSVLPGQTKAVDSRAVLWPGAARAEASHALALEDSATRAPSAAAYERVAQSWQRVLDMVPSGSGTSDARDHLAEARFRAWESAPTAARAQAARAALDAYLVAAPAGARRTLAEQRRERLPR